MNTATTIDKPDTKTETEQLVGPLDMRDDRESADYWLKTMLEKGVRAKAAQKRRSSLSQSE